MLKRVAREKRWVAYEYRTRKMQEMGNTPYTASRVPHVSKKELVCMHTFQELGLAAGTCL